MRERKTRQGLTVQGIAGSYVVLLGMDMKRSECDGHLGFAIHRTDHEKNEAYWLEGLKTFQETDPGFAPGSKYPTNEHPIQGFTWSDFSAKPGRRYTYRVEALRGSPKKLTTYKAVEIDIATESEQGGDQDVFFNRGAAASQEYARRFKNRMPDVSDPTDKRWEWLSRGAMEAITAFTERAKNGDWGLRVAAYEFRLPAFASALRVAHQRGVDVRIVYDGANNPPDAHGVVFPRDENRSTAKTAKVQSLCTERMTRAGVKTPPLSHHKFIVLLKKDQPQAVLTGSTKFSLGGVFGQSNVVHIVDDAEVAAAYRDCWDLIAVNPPYQALRTQLSQMNTIPKDSPPKGTMTVFSPQVTRAALDWYARLADGAQDALFMTFAFGINKVFLDVYKHGTAKLRYAMLDKLLAPGVPQAKRAAAEKDMRILKAMKENRFAVGNRLTMNKFDRWVKEMLPGLNTHVSMFIPSSCSSIHSALILS